eukprot:5982285-Amphidinium_carterae.3
MMKLEQPGILPGVAPGHVCMQVDGNEEQPTEQQKHSFWVDVETGGSEIEDECNQLLEATYEFSEEQTQLAYLTTGGMIRKHSRRGGPHLTGKGSCKDHRAQIQAAGPSITLG